MRWIRETKRCVAIPQARMIPWDGFDSVTKKPNPYNVEDYKEAFIEDYQDAYE